MSKSKRCTGCGEERTLDQFGADRRASDGRDSRCRTCEAIRLRLHKARGKGLPATLTWQEIGDPPGNCPCCGERMERGGDQRSSPSLDKLIPEAGYTEANAMWLCVRCNAIKQDATPDDLYRVADHLYEVYRERGIPCVTRLRPLNYVKGEAAATTRPTGSGATTAACHPVITNHSNAEEEPQ